MKDKLVMEDVKAFLWRRRIWLLAAAGVLALIPRAGRTPLAHRMLVPVIIAFLIWQKREHLAKIPRAFSPVGPLLMAAGVLMNIIGWRSSPELLEPLGIVFLAIGIGFTFLGLAQMRELAFPAAFLLLLVPWQDVLSEILAPPMQMFTTTYACALGRLTGLHPVQDGIFVHLAAPHPFSFEVAAACSGLQSLMALTAMAALYAYYTRAPLWKRWIVFLVGIPLALIMNVVRIWIIMATSQWINPETAMDFFHEYSAPLLFVMLVFGLQGLKAAFEGRTPPAPSPDAGESADGTRATLVQSAAPDQI